MNIAISIKLDGKTGKLKPERAKRLKRKVMMSMGMLEDEIQHLRRSADGRPKENITHVHSNGESMDFENGVVKIQCMDFRLPMGGFRNAGGNLVEFRDYLVQLLKNDPEHTIREVEVTGHRDCGGLKAVLARLNGDDLGLDHGNLEQLDKTADYFRALNLKGASLDDLAGKNGEARQKVAQERLAKIEDAYVGVQRGILNGILKEAGREDVKASVGIVDVARGLHAEMVLVAVGNPHLQERVAPGSSYVICVPEARLAEHSAILARDVLGKKDFSVVADKGVNPEGVSMLKAELGIKQVRHGPKLH